MAEQDSKKRPRRDLLSVLGMVAVAGAAAFTSYSGLYGLAHLAGWPGKLAMMLPVTVDAYAMTATRVWLSPDRLTAKARSWARGNAIGAIATSVLGNALFHAASAHVLTITWPIVVALSAIPPITLGLTVHLWHTADDITPEPETKSPGPAIAEPETVRAAYPILGTPAPTRPEPARRPTGPAPTPGSPTRPALPAPGRPATPARVAASPAPLPANKLPLTPAPSGDSWEQMLAKARAANAKALAETGAPASVAKLKAEVGVGQSKAQQLRDALATPAPTPTRPADPGSAVLPAPAPVPAPALPGQRRTPGEVAAPVEHANGQTRPAPDAG